MNFVSWAFVALFLVVFAARLTVGRRKIESPYVGVLLLSSLVFYGWHIPAYLAVLVGGAAIDYVAAIAIGNLAPDQQRRRRAWLVASLVMNLGLLGRSGRVLRGHAAPPGVRAGAADGHQLLYVPDALLHDRRLSRGAGAGAQLPALPALHQLLPAARRRADRPRQ
jgi:hypothetical protein